MRKVEEYEEHARECLRLAASMKDRKHKRALEEMAAAWMILAEERRRQIQKKSN
jgi:hypothetical protein